MFVLNKVDILNTSDEVAQVSTFVEEKARLLLGIESATVIPVSARTALDAKVSAGSGQQGGVLQSVDVEEVLGPDERWQRSKFLELERYMLRFLTGAGSNSNCLSSGFGVQSVASPHVAHGSFGESVPWSSCIQSPVRYLRTAYESSHQQFTRGIMGRCAGGAPGDGAEMAGGSEEDAGESTRLKLQTPLFVADALMQAAERQLDLEKTYCEEEVRASAAGSAAFSAAIAGLQRTIDGQSAATRDNPDIFSSVVEFDRICRHLEHPLQALIGA